MAHFLLADEDQTLAFGRALAELLQPGLLIFLQGDLGAGKTTLARGVLRGLGHQGNVKSPTYTLVETYHLPAFTLYHFDLYRIADPEELEFAGIRDYLDASAVSIIEWPERGAGILPEPDLRIAIASTGSGRKLEILGDSPEGHLIINRLNAKFSLLD